MNNGILFESNSGYKYFYDDLTGHIVYIEDTNSIDNYINKYRKIRDKKNIPSNDISSKDIYDYLIENGNGFKQLILEVTTKCNFRCKYCTYSDNYEFTRSHGSNFMAFDTAKLAIDYYMENFETVYKRNFERAPIISFYGGEPLLNFALIENTVTYLKSKYKEYKQDFQFHITTNGLLLSEKIQKFLYENKFNVLVSIDGYKENHDRNRVLSNGLPTFDKVYKNYINFKKNFPEASVFVSACYDFKTDMNKFAIDSDNAQIEVLRASLITNSENYYKQFSQDERNLFAVNFQKMKNRFFAKATQDILDKREFLYKFFVDTYGSFAYHRMISEDCPNVRPYTSTCVPGEKIYVESDGNFIICEKTNNKEKIGNVYQGLDYNKIAKIMHKYNNAMATRCSTCVATRLCTLCFKDFYLNESFCANEELCKNQLNSVRQLLIDYVNLLEQNPKLFEEITTDYYSHIAMAGGAL